MCSYAIAVHQLVNPAKWRQLNVTHIVGLLNKWALKGCLCMG